MEKSIQIISQNLGIQAQSVAKVITLLEEGNSIPFIARYRKEITNSLNEVEISDISKELKKVNELIQRKESVIASIEEQGKMTPELKAKLLACFDINVLEDLYLPYKKKRKTKADTARDAGLEPLAKLILQQNTNDIFHAASRYLKDDVENEDAAIDLALEIVKEWIAETDGYKDRFRETFRRYGIISAKVNKKKIEEASNYKDYFDYSEKLDKCPSHRYLAIMRGEEEGLLKLNFDIDHQKAIEYIEYKYLKKGSSHPKLMKKAIKEAYEDYILPSVQSQIKREYKEKADETAIKVFSANLEQLLLASPLGNKPILAIDPGFKSGCKVVCLDDHGDYITSSVIYPTEPYNKKSEAEAILKGLIYQHNIKAIALGNGTASRETKDWLESINDLHGADIYMVSENGASIYSASDIARQEFPDLDLTVRGSISIGRRLMDPLAELIKIDPKSIGVGQYQHDVNQTKLRDSLDNTVALCANRVGVDLNTASVHLLSHISGLGPVIAKNIIEHRNHIGHYTNKNQLKDVARLGPKAFEQSAGFLRIREGENPLDNTGIHPERFPIVEKIAESNKVSLESLIGNKLMLESISKNNYTSDTVGLETINDIFIELSKPGHDPRGWVEKFDFDKSICKIEDLKIGQTIPGVITNITNFGAFVDIGVKQDGLIHISQISERRITNPAEVLSLDQKLLVKVIDLDVPRKRINLSLRF